MAVNNTFVALKATYAGLGGLRKGEPMKITVEYDLTPEQVEKLARIGESRGRSGRSPEDLRKTFDDILGWIVNPGSVTGWIDLEAEMLDFGALEQLDFGDLEQFDLDLSALDGL